MRGPIRVLPAALALLATATPAWGHGEHAPRAMTSAPPESCPGDAIRTDRVITGEFAAEFQGSYVMVPFNVPRGTRAVRVKYCYDQPESPSSSNVRHTLDLGLYHARSSKRSLWGPAEFRGWGGSSHPDVTVSREGFGPEDRYLESPRAHVPGKTTRGFRPGSIPSGEWAAELGVAAVVPQSQGDSDGSVAWRLEVELSRNPADGDEPYRAARFNETPARRGPGWYAGDLHVHAEHSSLGDATMTETFDYAFRPLAEGGAGLDFITLSDYVTDSAWGEVGRYQRRYPGKQIIRSSEVITYQGHANNQATLQYVDHRTGPVFERAADGSLDRRRSARPARDVLRRIHREGGWTQINHPTIFPSSVPGFANLCRGCPWDYSAEETAYDEVDAIEIATGPAGLQGPVSTGPNPFTVTAIEFWESALAAGHRIPAIGVSDSHNAGRSPNPVTQAPIGQATTVVYAPELSEEGIWRGIQAGHTYVKLFGNHGPDLRLEGRAPGSSDPPAIMGDVLRAEEATFEARVTGAGPNPAKGTFELRVVKDGSTMSSVPILTDDFSYSFDSAGPGRYRLQVQRGSSIEAVSSPIYLDPGGGRPRKPRLRVRGAAASKVRVRRGAFRVTCRAVGEAVEDCRVKVSAQLAGRRRTIGKGRVRTAGGTKTLKVRLTRTGRRAVARRRRGLPVTLDFWANGGGRATHHALPVKLKR